MTLRWWFVIATAICAALVGFALYQQHRYFMDPCPLCIFQRLGFMWIGAFGLLAAIHNPGRAGQWVYSILVLIGAAGGGAVAGRHVWLQNLPADQVPACGPGLNYMLDNFPLLEVLSSVLFGDGSCAEVHWRFLGLTMPGWTLTWFVLLALGTLFFALRHRSVAGR